MFNPTQHQGQLDPSFGCPILRYHDHDMTIRIVTDSTCDLPEDTIAAYGISVVPLYINFNHEGYLDGIELSRAEFYARLPNANPLPTTATPSPFRFAQVYEGLAAEGATEILSIHAHLFPAGKTPLFAEVTPVIGTHIGPGAVGFACVAAPKE
jgi:fatty acid-binding protein DegV